MDIKNESLSLLWKPLNADNLSREYHDFLQYLDLCGYEKISRTSFLKLCEKGQIVKLRRREIASLNDHYGPIELVSNISSINTTNDLDAIVSGLKSADGVPMPLLAKNGDEYDVIGGRTRLMVAWCLKLDVLALAIEITNN